MVEDSRPVPPVTPSKGGGFLGGNKLHTCKSCKKEVVLPCADPSDCILGNQQSRVLCDGCKFEIKKPCGVPFECVDGSTYCAGCFVDRSMTNFIEPNGVRH